MKDRRDERRKRDLIDALEQYQDDMLRSLSSWNIKEFY